MQGGEKMSLEQIRDLDRIVRMYLDFADLQATRRVPMKMTDWVGRVEGSAASQASRLFVSARLDPPPLISKSKE